MSAVPKHYVTPQEYLEKERRAEFKSEYYKGEVFAMAGATTQHTLIKDNLARETGNALKDRPCMVLTSDQRVLVTRTGLYTYPDIVVVCETPQYAEDSELDNLLNPQIIVEVLSRSTEVYDRDQKFFQYSGIKSLKEYILVSQTAPSVERFVRQTGDDWLLTKFRGIEAIFEYSTIPVKVPLAEIYRMVKFEEEPLR